MNIGEAIKWFRTENSMTQKQLAEIANISEISIRKYEANDRIPKIGTLSKIAKALNVSIGDLDSEYTIMTDERNDASQLATQLEQFIEELPKMNVSEESKLKNLSDANTVLVKAKNLVKQIDKAISADLEKKELLSRNKLLKKGVRESEQELFLLFLSVIYSLNAEGKDKVYDYAIDLSNVPEYKENEQLALENYVEFIKDKSPDYWEKFRDTLQELEDTRKTQE